MYSKYYKPKKMREDRNSGGRRTSFTSGVSQHDAPSHNYRLTKHRNSEPVLPQHVNDSNVNRGVNVDLERLVEDHNAQTRNSVSPDTTRTIATPTTQYGDDLTPQEKREIRETKLKFQRENKKYREAVYLALSITCVWLFFFHSVSFRFCSCLFFLHITRFHISFACNFDCHNMPLSFFFQFLKFLVQSFFFFVFETAN